MPKIELNSNIRRYFCWRNACFNRYGYHSLNNPPDFAPRILHPWVSGFPSSKSVARILSPDFCPFQILPPGFGLLWVSGFPSPKSVVRILHPGFCFPDFATRGWVILRVPNPLPGPPGVQLRCTFGHPFGVTCPPLPLRHQNRRRPRRHNCRRERLWRIIVIIKIVVAIAVIISVPLSSSSPASSQPQNHQHHHHHPHHHHPHHHQSATAQRTLIKKRCLGSRCRSGVIVFSINQIHYIRFCSKYIIVCFDISESRFKKNKKKGIKLMRKIKPS